MKKEVEKEDLYTKDWNKRIEDIKNNLYLGGGIGQANSLLSIMMSPYGKDFGVVDIDPIDMLTLIGNQIQSLRKTIKNGGIVPIKLFEQSFQKSTHMAYAVLDKNLKFCVKHYGDKDWKDILYVFPYMNCTTAYDITFEYENIHQSE